MTGDLGRNKEMLGRHPVAAEGDSRHSPWPYSETSQPGLIH